MTLEKIVLVIEPDCWVQMYPDCDGGIERAKNDRERCSAFRDQMHIERWSYPVLPDGTHGAPRKRRLSL